MGNGQLDDYVITPSADSGSYNRNESVQTSSLRHATTPSASKDLIAPRDHVPNCPNPKTYAIYITGSPENAFIEATVRFAGALTPTDARDVAPTGTGDFRTLYTAAFNALNAVMTPCDTLVVYAASHGGWDEEADSASGNIMYKRTSAALGKQQTQWIGATDLIFPIRNLNACHLEVIIDACFGGAMLSEFRQAFNFAPLRDTERIVVVSADAASSAVFAEVSTGSELFGTTLGGLFTNELIANGGLNVYPSALAGVMNTLKAQSGVFTVDSVTVDQGADYLYVPASTPCGATGTVPTATPATEITATPSPSPSPSPTATPAATTTTTPTPTVAPTATAAPSFGCNSGTYNKTSGDSGCGIGTISVDENQQAILNPGGSSQTVNCSGQVSCTGTDLTIFAQPSHTCTFTCEGQTMVTQCTNPSNEFCEETLQR